MNRMLRHGKLPEKWRNFDAACIVAQVEQDFWVSSAMVHLDASRVGQSPRDRRLERNQPALHSHTLLIITRGCVQKQQLVMHDREVLCSIIDDNAKVQAVPDIVESAFSLIQLILVVKELDAVLPEHGTLKHCRNRLL